MMIERLRLLSLNFEVASLVNTLAQNWMEIPPQILKEK